MYVARAAWPSSNGKTYTSIYLPESFRDGPHVRKSDIANLTHCDPREIAAIELVLQHKGDLSVLASVDHVQVLQGPSCPVHLNSGASKIFCQRPKCLEDDRHLQTSRLSSNGSIPATAGHGCSRGAVHELWAGVSPHIGFSYRTMGVPVGLHIPEAFLLVVGFEISVFDRAGCAVFHALGLPVA